MEEVKRKEMQLYQLKKKIAENESKLKQQQVSTNMQGTTYPNAQATVTLDLQQCIILKVN